MQVFVNRISGNVECVSLYENETAGMLMARINCGKLMSGCKILGVILNQVSRKSSSGGGYYSAKYSSEYYGYHENASVAHAPQKVARPAAPAQGTQVRRPQASVARPINKDKQ